MMKAPADLVHEGTESAHVAGHGREVYLLLCDAATQTAAMVAAPGV